MTNELKPLPSNHQHLLSPNAILFVLTCHEDLLSILPSGNSRLNASILGRPEEAATIRRLAKDIPGKLKTISTKEEALDLLALAVSDANPFAAENVLSRISGRSRRWKDLPPLQMRTVDETVVGPMMHVLYKNLAAETKLLGLRALCFTGGLDKKPSSSTVSPEAEVVRIFGKSRGAALLNAAERHLATGDTYLPRNLENPKVEKVN